MNHQWRCHCFLLLIVVVLGSGSAIAKSSDDAEAKIFVDQSSERYYRIYNQIAADSFHSRFDEEAASKYWQLGLLLSEVHRGSYNEEVVSEFRKLTTQARIGEEMLRICSGARKFDLNTITDVQTKHALTKLRALGDLFVLNEHYFSRLLMKLMALEDLSTDKNIEPYLGGANMPNKDDSKLAYYPDIQKIVQRSTDADELKYYWETWREKNGHWSSRNFYGIVKSIQSAARSLEMPVRRLWFRYNSGHILDQMEQAMSELMPAYEQLHAFIRDELRKKYGNDTVDANGPIPDHLFQQVLEQAWEEGSIIESYFPLKELPQYDDFVKQLSAKALINESERFYTSLGFEPLSTEFRQHQLKESDENKEGDDCRAAIFDSTPHVYLKYCEKVNFRKLMEDHSHMARVYFAQQKKNLPAHYFNSYDLEYSVGEAVVLSAASPTHLVSVGLAQSAQFTEKALMNGLFRMAIRNILNIPLYYVHTKVMNDLLTKTVDMDTVNKHYWKLMEQHAGVEPPSDRTENAIDFPYTFYVGVDKNHQTKEFVTKILGYQFYRALCQKTSHSGQLHNCDFYGNLEVGNDLKSMMSLGSSKPWREVIGKLLPNNSSLSSSALLDYYQPILNWLENQNKKSNVKIGWNSTKRKIA